MINIIGAIISGLIQVPDWPARGAAAQAVITSANAVSKRISH